MSTCRPNLALLPSHCDLGFPSPGGRGAACCVCVYEMETSNGRKWEKSRITILGRPRRSTHHSLNSTPLTHSQSQRQSTCFVPSHHAATRAGKESGESEGKLDGGPLWLLPACLARGSERRFLWFSPFHDDESKKRPVRSDQNQMGATQAFPSGCFADQMHGIRSVMTD